jgi:hypothetical protein
MGRALVTHAVQRAISLQDLRRRLYIKAKAEPAWRFWGLYVHICKRETLRGAYLLAKANDGAPGIDGVTFVQGTFTPKLLGVPSTQRSRRRGGPFACPSGLGGVRSLSRFRP